MRIAIVITSKNEERLLRDNLLYHHFLGVDIFYLYLDNSTDNTRQSVSDLSFVEINNTVDASKFADKAELALFINNQSEHHTARQCLNSFDALQKCKKDNIDWIISLDADELICTDLENAEKDQLKYFFSNLNPNIDAVQFRVYEAFQRRFKYNNVFNEETLFKAVKKFDNKLDRLTRVIYNPYLGKKLKANYWYGHHLGKMALNTKIAFLPKNVHRFKRADDNPLTVFPSDGLLHYHAYDFEDFIKKFKNFENHPDTFLSGNRIEDVKMLWRDVVNKSGLNDKDLAAYFKGSVMFDEKWIQKALSEKHFGLIARKQIGIKEITTVKNVFDQIANSTA